MSIGLIGSLARRSVIAIVAAALGCWMQEPADAVTPDRTGGAAPLLPPRAIVILVASWCAPCRGELAALDTIADAAGGRTLRVLAIDDSAATGRMLQTVRSDRIWRHDPRIEQARAALLARTAGLPFSVVTDVNGHVCAQENGGLNTARTIALINRCGAP